MEKTIQTALGQDHNSFIKWLHLQELNKVIRGQRTMKIRELSFTYWCRKEELRRLLENKPRFDPISRLFYKKDVEKARGHVLAIEKEIRDLGLKITKEK